MFHLILDHYLFLRGRLSLYFHSSVHFYLITEFLSARAGPMIDYSCPVMNRLSCRWRITGLFPYFCTSVPLSPPTSSSCTADCTVNSQVLWGAQVHHLTASVHYGTQLPCTLTVDHYHIWYGERTMMLIRENSSVMYTQEATTYALYISYDGYCLWFVWFLPFLCLFIYQLLFVVMFVCQLLSSIWSFRSYFISSVWTLCLVFSVRNIFHDSSLV